MEVYLEGNVILRQDENKYAGKGDQRTVRAPQLYYDFLTDRMLAPNGRDRHVRSVAPGAGHASRRRGSSSFARPVMLPNGDVHARSSIPRSGCRSAIMTGSRFPNPGYSISSKSIDLTRNTRPLTNPDTGKEVNDPDNPAPPPEEDVWHVDARQNFYYGGTDSVLLLAAGSTRTLTIIEPPLRMIGFNSINYFGQQLKTDWNGFRLLEHAQAQVRSTSGMSTSTT